MRNCRALFAICFFFPFVFCFASLADSRLSPRTVIPSIARIGGIVVGQDTIDSMRKRFGPGAKSEGQHPTGARSWKFARLGLGVYADGFDYDGAGLIVNTYSIFIADGYSRAKNAPSRRDIARLGFAGAILPGMSKKEALKRLKDTLPPPVAASDEYWKGNGKEELEWSAGGKSDFDINGNPRSARWNAKLLFDHDILSEIDVQCD